MNELVHLSGVTKSYDRQAALLDVNLDLQPGRIVGLLGPNGAGKTTLIKLLNGLLQPDAGVVEIDGTAPGVYTKSIVSYLPDRTYLAEWMKVGQVLDLFQDFYADFDRARAEAMCENLHIAPNMSIKTMSKGTLEKMQLVLVMSRQAKLYLLDEPIAGVDPAARDYIMDTILSNYNPEGTVLISTHLIADVERVLDEAVFLQEGRIVLHDTVDNIREREGMSVDELFRAMFRMI
ncbi:MAG: ABC transporter ATP-binding protein [Clostridiales bacterium]|nr:ABC transporter ATP-binding protein [Clostridiales bacterium]